jgi:hypothetical protein
MASFDSELYLRLVGERTLAERGPQRANPFHSPLESAAAALRAVDAIDEETAQSVIDDYALAAALRNAQLARHRTHVHRSAQRTPARPLEQRRTVAIDRAIETAAWQMQIQYASLSPSSTTVAVRLRAKATSGQTGRRVRRRLGPGGIHQSGPPQATITDDRGTSTLAHFGGSGTEEEWVGRFHTHAPLATDTRWLEIDGQRIELVDRELGVEVSIEPVPSENPAVAHLWSTLASMSQMHHTADSTSLAIDALVAGGAIDASAPELTQIRAAEGALTGAPAVPSSVALPERWRSLLTRQGTTGGVVGTALIGAVTPIFDGCSIAAISLDANDSGFDVSVEVSPGGFIAPYGRMRGPSGSIAWWASDDRDNWYLGQMGSWGGNDAQDTGEIGFSPALDPRATRLDLLPTGPTTRAVIRIPLPFNGTPT